MRLLYKKHLKKNDLDSQRVFPHFQDQIRLAIENSKLRYCQKLSNKLSSMAFKGNHYWSPLKKFLVIKSIPCISTLICDSKFVTDFHWKIETFNLHFAKQCSSIKINSRMPSVFLQATEKMLSIIRHVWKIGLFHLYGKWLTLFLSIKKKASNLQKIADPFHYYQSVAKD